MRAPRCPARSPTCGWARGSSSRWAPTGASRSTSATAASPISASSGSSGPRWWSPAWSRWPLKLRDRHTCTWLVRRQLDALAVTLVLYTVFPTHLVSANVNVARIEKGEYRPVLHMFRQSTQPESAAALVPLLQHSDLRVRQGVAALLEHEREVLRRDVDGQASWRERDIASRRALSALDAAAPDIATVLGTVDREAARHVLPRGLARGEREPLPGGALRGPERRRVVAKLAYERVLSRKKQAFRGAPSVRVTGPARGAH